MKNKKGFTLVELLAVIAILAILVIIALPNVMRMFNNAKKSSFETEVRQVFKMSKTQWMSDNITSSSDVIYSKCESGCKNELKNLDSRNGFDYYVKVNSSGKVVNLYATDGTFQYEFKGSTLDTNDKIESTIIADIPNDKKISIKNESVFINGKVVEARELDTDNCIIEVNGTELPSLKKVINDLSKNNPSYLIKDEFSNIRYYSTNNQYDKMSNFLKFEGDNKEFRIIGIIDGEVKIEDPIYYGSYNIKLRSACSGCVAYYESSEMDNWTTSSMLRDLNTTYYDSLTELEKNSIINHTWGFNSGVVGNKANIYKMEREAALSNDKSQSWTGKIASTYVSDYFYSGPGNTRSDRWLVFNLNANYYNMTNSDVVAYSVLPLNGKGWIGARHSYKYQLLPTMYLSPNVFVKLGDGTKNNPYIITLDNTIKCK